MFASFSRCLKRRNCRICRIYQTRTVSIVSDNYDCRARDTPNSFDFPADFKVSRSSEQRSLSDRQQPERCRFWGRNPLSRTHFPKILGLRKKYLSSKRRMKSSGHTSILLNCVHIKLCAVSFRIYTVVGSSNLRADRTVSLLSPYGRFIEGCLFTF